MNLFLAKKTNPLKSNLAKIFAIFLVCFFVGGIGNKVLAQGIPMGDTNYSKNIEPKKLDAERYAITQMPWTGTTVYGTEKVDPFGGLLGNLDYFKGSSNAEVNTVVFKDPSDNSVYKVMTFKALGTYLPDGTTKRLTFKINPDGTQTQVENFQSYTGKSYTQLELDPTTLPKDGPIGYDYKEGQYTYTDGNGNKVLLSPDNIIDTLKKIQSEEGNAEQKQKIATSMAASAASTFNQTGKAAKNVAATGDPNKEKDLDCGWTDIPCLLARAIYYITIVPAGWVLAASGWFLDKVFLCTVVDLKGTLMGGGEAKCLGAGNVGFYNIIKMIWAIFRDLINMSFIFLLLYASIVTILKADTSQLKTTVKNIIIVAVLINFSLFFVEVIIDVSNQAAVTIYNTINQSSGSTPNNLAAAFMQKLKMETLLSNARPTEAGKSNLIGMMSISIFGSVFILVLAVLFFVIAILFVLRFVEFIILMMMSPLGIGSIAIPKLNSMFGTTDFWNKLIRQAIFAPVMIFFLWISIQLLDAVVALGGPNKPELSAMITDKNQAEAGIGTFVLAFSIIVFVLIKGMATAKSISAKGATGMQNNFLQYSGANWLQERMRNTPRVVGNGVANIRNRAVNSTGGRALNAFTNSGVGQAIGSTRLGNRLYNLANRGGAGWRNSVAEAARREMDRAELRTSAATSGEERRLREQQQILADANILRAQERAGDRATQAAAVEVATRALTTAGYRDLAHAQEERTRINEEIQNIDREIANHRSTIQRVQAEIQASGGVATAAQQAELNAAATNISTQQGTRTTTTTDLDDINRLIRPLQTATQALERIDTDLGNLYSGYNRQLPAESAAAINRLATEIRRNGDASIRTMRGLTTRVGAAAGTTALQDHIARALNPTIQQLQAQIRNTQIEHSRQNATGAIAGAIGAGNGRGILATGGLTQAGRQAAADEYRQRYTRREGGNR